MHIRDYKPSDCKEIAELFYNTVHSINAIDYSTEQLDVWASGKVNLQEWNDSFIEHYTLVAVENDTLLEALEKSVDGNLVTVHASKTAKAFLSKKALLWSKIVKRSEMVLNCHIV